jgi:hypothetical protein
MVFGFNHPTQSRIVFGRIHCWYSVPSLFSEIQKRLSKWVISVKTFGVSSEVFLYPRNLQGCNFLPEFDRPEPNKFQK